jgi:hydrogenase/urease accessory protein HupE
MGIDWKLWLDWRLWLKSVAFIAVMVILIGEEIVTQLDVALILLGALVSFFAYVVGYQHGREDAQAS